jgi:plastocyanin
VRRALLAALGAVLAVTPAAAAPVARLQVVAREFRFTLSRTSVRAGPAIVELVNFGEDPHDLRLHRIGGTRTFSTGTVGPGRHVAIRIRLVPGRYVLWCSIADHRRLGMQARLRVRR